MIAQIDPAEQPGLHNPRFLATATAALNYSQFERRQLNFRLVLDRMRPEDALILHWRFVELERAGRPFAHEYAAFATRWGQLDGEGAMAFCATLDPAFLKNRDLENFIRGWGMTRPEAALAWIKSHPDQMAGRTPYPPLLQGWLDSDPQAATAWLTSQKILNPGQLSNCLSSAFLNELYASGLGGTTAWLASLPDDGPFADAVLAAWNNNQDRFGNLNPEQASVAMANLINEPWLGVAEFESFSGNVARANNGNRAKFMECLAEKWPEPQVSEKFRQWAVNEPQRVGALLLNLPTSPLRTAGIKGLLKTLESTDPTTAAIWQRQLEE